MGFHQDSNAGMPTLGFDRLEDRAARHVIPHTMERYEMRDLGR
jgi:hypothetical protein